MSVSRQIRLREIVASEADSLEKMSAQEIMAWTAVTFGDQWIAASNLQDAVLIDLAVRVNPRAQVLFLDTGYHFPETLGVRDALRLAYPDLRIVNVTPELSVAEQDAVEGPELFRTNPDRCCQLRKVIPLRRMLQDYDAWLTGMRRSDSPARRNAPVISWDEQIGLVKINPIATWSDSQLAEYIFTENIIQNLLVPEGYLSVGCAPCTVKSPVPGDARSGRWAGTSKTECGLHG